MGIQNLMNMIKKYCPEAIRKIDIKELKGKTIAIDTSMLIYRYVIAIRNTGKDMLNNDGDLTSHLNGIFYKTLTFLDAGIKPIYIFDGAPPAIKDALLKERRKKKNDALKNVEDVKKFKSSFSLTKEHIEECKILLELMGIPYIVAPEEADPLCSYLTQIGVIDGICTEDMDVLTFGGTIIYRGLMGYSKTNSKIDILEISLEGILTGLELDYEQFVDLCVLLGCDYCDTIKYMGKAKAYVALRSGKYLKEIIETQTSPVLHSKTLYTAKKYFMECTGKINIKKTDIKWKTINTDALIDFMVEKHGFDLIKMKTLVNSAERKYKLINITEKNTTTVHKIIKEKNNYCLFIDE